MYLYVLYDTEMRRRGLRRETADLDKKIWDWSLTEPSATKTKIQNYAKNLFCEAGFESFKASDCWYRRWRSRWRNTSDKTDEASSNPTELKQHSSEYKLQKMNRRNSKSTKDDINTGGRFKRPNPGTGHSNDRDNLQISSSSDRDEMKNNDNQSNRTIQIEESNKQVVITSDRISQKNSVGQENDVIFSGLEFSDISTQSTKLNSKYCSQLGISDGTSPVMQLGLLQKDGICGELMNKKNICSLGGISDDYPIKTHIKDGRSSTQELENKIMNTATLMNEIDSSLGQIDDCFKTQTSISFSQMNESNINCVGMNNVGNCQTIDGIRVSDDAYLEGNMRNISNSKTENSYTYAVDNMNDRINPFSCGNAQLQTVSSDNITTQITHVLNSDSFCINENDKNTMQFENFVDVSNESIFTNFAVANFEETTNSTDRPNKISTELGNTENFVEISNDSVFPSFSAANLVETTYRPNELVTELKSVGLDLGSKDQHSLELMKVINSNFNGHSENSVSSDNLDACLMSAEFQIPGLSLGSDEIFENYRNSLFMESNYLFCENCDDFHMNDDNDGFGDISNYEEILSLKISEIDQQSKSGEQESVDKNNGVSNKEKDVCSKDGDGSGEQFISSGRQMQRKEDGITSNCQRERKKVERYLPKFKAKVVAHTKSHTIRATALKFNVNESTVSEWIQAKLRQNKKQDFEPYKESKLVNVEQQFLNWLESMRQTQRPLSQPLICEKLVDLMKPEENFEKRTEKWLEHYLERLKSEQVPSESDQVVKMRKISRKFVIYSFSFKREVALYAAKLSQKAAARDFGVSRKRVYEWMQTFKEDSHTQDGSKVLKKRDCSSYVTDATIDKNIIDWYKSQSVPSTSKQVREMGLKLYADEGYDVTCSYGWWRRWSKRHQVRNEAMSSLDNHLLEWVLGQLDSNVKVSHADLTQYVSKIGTKKAFSKVSSGWVIRFCKRYPTLLQRTPQFNTNLPLAMELKVLLFRKRIQELIGKFEITESDIGTIDEIPIRFTDTGVRLKEQLIRRSGFDNCQASLVISCLANGRLLPSIVIVKGSQSQDLALSNEDVMVFVRENSCLDSEIFLHWIKNVWSMSQTQKTSILVSNNFHPYKDALARRELLSVSCKHEFFPPGCLSKLQPIRVALSTAFQDGLYEFRKEQVKITSWDYEISTINLPSHHDVFDWTTQIHRKLAANFQEEIKLSFKKTLLAENENKFEQDTNIQSTQRDSNTNQEDCNGL